MLAAAAAPDIALSRPSGSFSARHFAEGSFVRTLLDHGHLETAISYLMNYARPPSYPYMVVALVIDKCTEGAKTALLRRSIQVWRDGQVSGLLHRVRRTPRLLFRYDFVQLFAREWTLLPEAEALTVLRDLVGAILRSEDAPIQGSFDPENRLSFTSTRAHQVFQLLHILRRLDPALADSLIASNRELAAAAELFPLGMESVRESRKACSPQPRPGEQRGFIMGVSGEHIAFTRTLGQALHSRQFEPAFQQALATLTQDLASNGALLECWPSTQSFRTLFYTMAAAKCEDADAYLARIPHSDVRLFAQIELAAGSAGLPAYSGTRVSSPRSSREH